MTEAKRVGRITVRGGCTSPHCFQPRSVSEEPPPTLPLPPPLFLPLSKPPALTYTGTRLLATLPYEFHANMVASDTTEKAPSRRSTLSCSWNRVDTHGLEVPQPSVTRSNSPVHGSAVSTIMEGDANMLARKVERKGDRPCEKKGPGVFKGRHKESK